MKGVDINNQLQNNYSYSNNIHRRWVAVFIRIIDICVVNSYIIYKCYGANETDHKEFRMSLIQALVADSDFKNESTNFKLDIRQFYKKYEDNKNKRCKSCSSKGVRTSTKFYCSICLNKTNHKITVSTYCQEAYIKSHLA